MLYTFNFPLYIIGYDAPVAQLDRALASGARGYGFDPRRARFYFSAKLKVASGKNVYGCEEASVKEMIYVLRQPATAQQIKDMLEVHTHFIKVAVDIQRGVVAGGGEFHADCEALLIEEGSERKDVWGADWIPDQKEVRFGALINIRPHINQSMEIQDSELRKHMEQLVRKLLDVS